jgi:hypothetical protein
MGDTSLYRIHVCEGSSGSRYINMETPGQSTMNPRQKVIETGTGKTMPEALAELHRLKEKYGI